MFPAAASIPRNSCCTQSDPQHVAAAAAAAASAASAVESSHRHRGHGDHNHSLEDDPVEVGPEALQNVAHDRHGLAPWARHLVQIIVGTPAQQRQRNNRKSTHAMCSYEGYEDYLARCLVVHALEVASG
jgi:hypothetical protein